MNREEITIGFKEQTEIRIAEYDIPTGKVVVNGIEITSVEDWENVTKSLIDLQQRIDKAIEVIENSYYSKNTTDIDSIVISNNKLLQVRNILKGETK